MMGSREQGVSTGWALNEITWLIVPTGTIRFTLSGEWVVLGCPRCLKPDFGTCADMLGGGGILRMLQIKGLGDEQVLTWRQNTTYMDNSVLYLQ